MFFKGRVFQSFHLQKKEDVGVGSKEGGCGERQAALL